MHVHGSHGARPQTSGVSPISARQIALTSEAGGSPSEPTVSRPWSRHFGFRTVAAIRRSGDETRITATGKTLGTSAGPACCGQDEGSCATGRPAEWRHEPRLSKIAWSSV